MKEPKRLVGSYCPLCGEKDLFLAVKGNKEIAYCGRNGQTPENTHTLQVVREIADKE